MFNQGSYIFNVDNENSILLYNPNKELPIDLLLEQLKSSGVDKSSASDELKEEDKSALLAYLRAEHGASLRTKSKITLTRKQNTQIRI